MAKRVRAEIDYKGEVWFNANDLIIAVNEAVDYKKRPRVSPAVEAIVNEMTKIRDEAIHGCCS